MHKLGADNSRLFPASASHNESSFSAWQRRLPKELRLRNFRLLRAADKFLGQAIVPAAQRGSHLFTVRGKNLEPIFSPHHERSCSIPLSVSIADRSAW